MWSFVFATVLLIVSRTSRAESQRRLPDSVRVDRMVREAQSRFETKRRVFLPLSISRPGNSCDEQIGRYCYWSDDLVIRPADSEGLRNSRSQLLSLLDSTARKYPGNDWIAGQRVRYRIEAQEYGNAMRAAQSCRGTESWCNALQGLALHFSGNYAEAERLFDVALEKMPNAARCRMRNVEMLIEGDLADEYLKRDCGQREAVEKRIWWLSDPAYSIPGNDRRTEHFARKVMDVVYADSRLANGNRWGPDAAEIMLRYGIYNFWTREPPPAGSGLSLPSITDHQATPSFHFLPEAKNLDSLQSLAGIRWKPSGLRLRERYAPAYARGFIALNPQVLRFVRGDSVMLVAGYNVSSDTAFTTSRVRAALVASTFEQSQPDVAVRTSASRRDTISLRTGSGLKMVGVEILSPDSQVLARSRTPLQIPPLSQSTVSLSDILLFETDGPLANNLTDAMTRMTSSERVSADRKVGLYWEIYNMSLAGDQVPVALTLTRQPGSRLERVRQNLGIKSRDAPLSIRWTEPGSSVVIASRSILLDLSLVPKGRYDLRIALGENSRPLAVALRPIEVR